MNLLIVGGNGFIGSELVQKFISQDHFVSVIDINENISKGIFKKKPDFYNINACDYNECKKVFEIGHFDVVYILCGSSFEEDINKSFEVDSSLNILNLCIEYKVKRTIYLSSLLLNDFESIDDNNLLLKYPEYYMYCTNKMVSEHYYRTYRKLFNIETVIVRLAPVFGPKQKSIGEGGFILKAFDAIKDTNKEEIVLPSNHIYPIYIKDAVNTLAQIIDYEHCNQKYIIAGNSIINENFIDILKDITSNLDTKVKIKYVFKFKLKSYLNDEVIETNTSNTLNIALNKTYKWYSSLIKSEKSTKTKKQIIAMKSKKHWIENIIFSFSIVIFNKLTNNVLDLSIIMVMVMSMMYGVKSGIISSFLISIFMMLPIIEKTNIDIFLFEKLIFNLFIAFVSGYKLSSKNKEIVLIKNSYERLEKSFLKIKGNLSEMRKSASILAEQLKTSDNSYYKTYNSIKMLENKTKNDILLTIPSVVTELTGYYDMIIHCEKIEFNDNIKIPEKVQYIKTLDKINSDHARLILEVYEKKELYINLNSENGIGVVIPVKNNNDVEAAIIVRDIPFDRMNINTEYLIRFVADILSDYYQKGI